MDNEWSVEHTEIEVTYPTFEYDHEYGLSNSDHTIGTYAEMALFYDGDYSVLLYVACPYFTTMIPLPKWIQMS